MNDYSQDIKQQNANRENICFPIKDFDEFNNGALYLHNLLQHIFNGNIGAPVLEKLQTGAKVLQFGCEAGIWIDEVSTEYPNTEFYAVGFIQREESSENVKFIEFDVHKIQPLPFPDDEFDLVFTRDHNCFFREECFQEYLTELFRVLKPGGYLEVGYQFNHDVIIGPSFTRLNEAWTSWFTANGINNDFILHFEDYLEKTGKADSITHQIGNIPVGDNSCDEYYNDMALYYFKSVKEVMAPFMGMSLKEYDELINEIEKEFKGCGKVNFKQKRVFARKK
ncbi:473_t:CDS:2 [Dentiscutata heterogama]|uniref:473_t:CDS:1 n=1 Tax=Dentiscutata heterogama TaxID=1316150 RepID=A0ACA9L8Q9_9GLOM|nr:473_t:CDS:2 [Dentiscutata heterogama]